jgi:hypothetical protein
MGKSFQELLEMLKTDVKVRKVSGMEKGAKGQ